MSCDSCCNAKKSTDHHQRPDGCDIPRRATEGAISAKVVNSVDDLAITFQESFAVISSDLSPTERKAALYEVLRRVEARIEDDPANAW
jgi:hypothetical protein